MTELSPKAMKQASNLAPKLTFAERCSVLACIRKEVSTRVIAAAFGINRRTVTHLSQAFRGYQKVHDEEMAMGQDAFVQKYMTEEVIARINKTADAPETKQGYSEYDATAGSRAGAPSRRASGMAGVNFIRPVGSDVAHRINVSWLEENTAVDHNGPFNHPAGWYWCDLDSEDKFWNGDPEADTHFTSSKAFAHAKQELQQ